MMPRTTTPSTNGSGMLSHAEAWLAGALRYLKARLSLAGIEAKEAAGKYAVATAFGVGALMLVVFGYVFLIITLVFATAAAFENEHAWIVIMGVAALLHVGGAAALVWLAWKRAKGAIFEVTLEELEKDRTWLSHSEK